MKLNQLFEKENPTDTITVDVPLLIRLLEYAHEDAKDDQSLHFLAEDLVKMMKKKDMLGMSDYDKLTSRAIQHDRTVK